MKTDYIDVDGSWGTILCYDLRRLDEYEMRASMMSFGIHGNEIEHAIDVLLYHEDTGMCISRDDIRMSLIFIGNSSSEEQMWDTISHELYHSACAICDYYHVSPNSEDFAWTVGYLMRKTVTILGEPCL